MKKTTIRFIGFCTVFTVFLTTALIAQENNKESANVAGSDAWFIAFGLHGILNTDQLELQNPPGMGSDGSAGGFSSAPSPLLFTLTAGKSFPLTQFLVCAPSLSFYMTYYLWANDMALPAEMEHRTAYVPTLLIDIPFVFRLQHTESVFGFGAGLAVAARYAVKASGVPSEEDGDIAKMNAYLWNGMRFLYPSIQLSYDYFYDDGLAIGAIIKAYVPIFNLFDKTNTNFFKAGMLSFGVRITFP